MRLSAAQMLPPRTIMRPLLDDVAWGAAAAALDTRADVIALLPTHTKVLSHTKTGERLVEVFLNWKLGPAVALADGATVEVTWSYTEHRKTTTGTAVLTAHAGVVDTAGDYPEHATAPRTHLTFGTRGWDRVIAKLTGTASESEWRLLSELERYVTFSLETANRRVAREIEGDVEDTDIVDYYVDRDNFGVVDGIAIEKLTTELLFGRAGAANGSVVKRLIGRCATTSINNQPLPSYLATNIYSHAEEHVRREIGDPHVGRKVRRLARRAGARDLESILAAYRQAHPNDELGAGRAIAALTAGKTIEATSTSTALFGGDDIG